MHRKNWLRMKGVTAKRCLIFGHANQWDLCLTTWLFSTSVLRRSEPPGLKMTRRDVSKTKKPSLLKQNNDMNASKSTSQLYLMSIHSLYNLRSTGKPLLDHPKGKMLSTLGARSLSVAAPKLCNNTWLF